MSKAITTRMLFLTVILIVSKTYMAFGQSSSPLKTYPKVDTPTQILILGTTHLSQIEDSFRPELLDSLISTLKRFKPDAIGVESISGEQIAAMKTQPLTYKPILNNFAGRTLNLSRQVTQIDQMNWSVAGQKADSLLAIKNLDTKQRLELISYLLASYREETATLQWSYLKSDIASEPQLTDSLTNQLKEIYHSANEISSIGLRLGHDLNHRQIYPIDDHTEKDLLLEISSQLMQELPDSVIKNVSQSSHLQKSNDLIDQGIKKGSLLDLYLFVNSNTYMSQDVDVQWDLFLRTNLPSKYDRSRLALWEVRNLHIAARIQRVAAQYPSGKILIIIGASHKAFLDDYLDRMMGIKIVQLSDYLN